MSTHRSLDLTSFFILPIFVATNLILGICQVTTAWLLREVFNGLIIYYLYLFFSLCLMIILFYPDGRRWSREIFIDLTFL